MPKKIAHLSSAHPRYDIRIFVKMCSSLGKNGYDVNLVIADGGGNETKNGVNIIDVGKITENRFSRMTKTVFRIYRAAIKLKSDVYHLHDPELMTIGVLLKMRGKKVIFDAHEDLPKQIKGKEYMNLVSRIVLSTFFSFFEWIVCRWFDYIITATPAIRDKFLRINANAVDINNYPLENELFVQNRDIRKRDKIVYTGVISSIRCAYEMTQAFNDKSLCNFYMAGSIDGTEIQSLIDKNPNVHYLGVIERTKISDLFSEAIAGLVLYKPLPNHIEAQPNKMFEYMSAGIPVIGSNFPLWRDIIERYDCGICIDPMSPKELVKAVEYLLSNPQRVVEMGENGRKTVEQIFNWKSQEVKLMDVYKKVLNG